MKAIIKIVTAADEFTEDQVKIMKRVAMALIEHNLSVDLSIKKKVKKREVVPLKLTKTG